MSQKDITVRMCHVHVTRCHLHSLCPHGVTQTVSVTQSQSGFLFQVPIIQPCIIYFKPILFYYFTSQRKQKNENTWFKQQNIKYIVSVRFTHLFIYLIKK